MIKHSFTGASLMGAVLMFLSSIGGCAKLMTKCARSTETASNIAKGAKNAEKLEDLNLIEKNLISLEKLYQSSRLIEVNPCIKLNLPEIAERIVDPRGYDNIYMVKDEANHFFVNTRSEPRSKTSLFEQWIKFKQINLAARTVLRSFTVYDSLNFTDNRQGVQTKAYQYCPYNDTMQGLVKLIETEVGFTFIEMETPKTTAGFYEFSDSFFNVALQISKKENENVTDNK